nr:hypothetical protein CFP56_25628 [Quercus suber]
MGNVETPQGLIAIKAPLKGISNHKTSFEEGMETMVALAITNVSNASLKGIDPRLRANYKGEEEDPGLDHNLDGSSPIQVEEINEPSLASSNKETDEMLYDDEGTY